MTRTGSVVGAVVVQTTVVVLSLLVAFGVDLDADEVAAITGAAGMLGVLLTVALFVVTLPRDKVLEYLVGDDTVVAGRANDLVAPGDEVRQLGA